VIGYIFLTAAMMVIAMFIARSVYRYTVAKRYAKAILAGITYVVSVAVVGYMLDCSRLFDPFWIGLHVIIVILGSVFFMLIDSISKEDHETSNGANDYRRDIENRLRS
jgi:hypothetical protein